MCWIFFSNEQGQKLSLRFENGVLSLDRSQTEQTELMEKFGSVRHCKIEQLETIEIFFDRSVVEIFVNGGEKVLTSRFFIAKRENVVKSSRPIQVKVAKVLPISVE